MTSEYFRALGEWLGQFPDWELLLWCFGVAAIFTLAMLLDRDP